MIGNRTNKATDKMRNVRSFIAKAIDKMENITSFRGTPARRRALRSVERGADGRPV